MNETGSKRTIAGNVIIIVISIVLALLLIIFYSLMRENFHSYHPDVSVVEYYGENGEFDDMYYNCMKNNEKSVPDKYMDMYRQLDGVGDYYHYELLARSKKHAGKEDEYKKYSKRAKEASARAGDYSNFIYGVDRVLNDYEKRGN